MLLITQARKHF